MRFSPKTGAISSGSSLTTHGLPSSDARRLRARQAAPGAPGEASGNRGPFPRVRFVFAGDGTLKDAIDVRIRTLGIERNVILTGFHPHPEQLIALADICLLASARRGCRVLMQYLAGASP